MHTLAPASSNVATPNLNRPHGIDAAGEIAQALGSASMDIAVAASFASESKAFASEVDDNINTWKAEFSASCDAFAKRSERISRASLPVSAPTDSVELDKHALVRSASSHTLVLVMHDNRPFFAEVQSVADTQLSAYEIDIKHNVPVWVPTRVAKADQRVFALSNVVDPCTEEVLEKPALCSEIQPNVLRLQRICNYLAHACAEDTEHLATGVCFLCKQPHIGGLSSDGLVAVCTFSGLASHTECMQRIPLSRIPKKMQPLPKAPLAIAGKWTGLCKLCHRFYV